MNPEAWSTGWVRFEIDGGKKYRPVAVAVELFHVMALVHVMARADCDDPALKTLFPITYSAVEVFPEVTIQRDPIGELGQKIAHRIVRDVMTKVAGEIERTEAVRAEMMRLEQNGRIDEGAPADPRSESCIPKPS